MQSFMIENTLWIIMSIILVIWIGIVIYMMSVDRKVKKLEKLVKTQQESNE